MNVEPAGPEPVGSGAMAAYSAAEIRAAEEPLLAAGVPLMQRAAAALAREIRPLLPVDRPGRVLALVGPGNNGGDALFAAADLASDGTEVTVAPTSDRMHEAGRAAAVDAGVRMLTDAAGADAGASVFRDAAAAADVIVDGILGTGTSASPALRGRARDLVAVILTVLDRPEPPVVVAVDIPSGVHPDDGSVPDPTVLPADLTVTFGACKTGLLLPPAVDYAGRIVVIDIGLGPGLALLDARR